MHAWRIKVRAKQKALANGQPWTTSRRPQPIDLRAANDGGYAATLIVALYMFCAAGATTHQEQSLACERASSRGSLFIHARDRAKCGAGARMTPPPAVCKIQRYPRRKEDGGILIFVCSFLPNS